jgi:hypothetical protein
MFEKIVVMNNLIELILCSAATWRLAHLLSKEDGPFDIMYTIRKAAGAGFFGSLLDCFYCTSVWVALPIGIWQGNSLADKILYWWALSGIACLLEQATNKPIYSKKNESNTYPIPQYHED